MHPVGYTRYTYTLYKIFTIEHDYYIEQALGLYGTNALMHAIEHGIYRTCIIYRIFTL